MSLIDIDKLLSEISSDPPCGADLEYDSEFGELERAAIGRAEQSLGDSTVAGEPPDWKAVRTNAVKIFSKTIDLRVAVLLTRALLHTDGLAGFGSGVALIRGMLERFWEPLHPVLDPEDDNDPTIRVNVIVALCDREKTINSLLGAPLIGVKGLGVVQVRTIWNAKVENSAPGDDDKNADPSLIPAIMMECPVEELKNTAITIAETRENLKAIDSFLMDTVGSSNAPDLGLLEDVLNETSKVVEEYLGKRGEGVAVVEDGAVAGQAGTSAAPMVAGEIQSREDATRMMDKIGEYFKKNEPSSPVPLLMNRAKRLSQLGFMEILKDIAPDGLKQAQNVGGIDGE